MTINPNEAVFNEVLAITRDQLARSMNLNAELEAILKVEQAKNEELQKKLAELEAAKDETEK
jgi:hypothetical protein